MSNGDITATLSKDDTFRLVCMWPRDQRAAGYIRSLLGAFALMPKVGDTFHCAAQDIVYTVTRVAEKEVWYTTDADGGHARRHTLGYIAPKKGAHSATFERWATIVTGPGEWTRTAPGTGELIASAVDAAFDVIADDMAADDVIAANAAYLSGL